jgi:hypothetical protein
VISLGNENNAFYNPISEVINRLGEISKSGESGEDPNIEQIRIMLDLLIVHSDLMTKERAFAVITCARLCVEYLASFADIGEADLTHLAIRLFEAGFALEDVEIYRRLVAKEVQP